MIDRDTSRTTGEVPEADLVEQSVPVSPDDQAADESIEQAVAAAVDRDAWNANEADLVEQSIPVPMDDEDRDPGE
ncbi:hypothetical protein [Nocardia sp. NPDC050710]|uniref:hypothetical protein n=1 Tax=Nocardia sp. NPDC050710 TaxID=3157220 RepID=UPI0033DE5B39